MNYRSLLIQFLTPILLLLSGSGLLHAAPELQSDGVIVYGDYRLIVRDSGIINVISPEGIPFDFFVPFTSTSKKKGSFSTLSGLKDHRVQIYQEQKSVFFSGTAEPPDAKPFKVSYGLTITDENRIRITLKYELDEPHTKYVSSTMRMHVSRQVVVGGTVIVNDSEYPIVEAPPGSENQALARVAKPNQIILNANNPEKQISFFPQTECDVAVIDHNNITYRPPYFDINFAPRGNELSVDIELPKEQVVAKSSDTYGGVDFWKNDRLHMPQYSHSKNLIQNPGFETGFSYWRWNTFGNIRQDAKHDIYDIISEENPHSGSRCLAIRGEPGISPAQISTFAIPLDKGAAYTLSFYAKGQNNHQLGVTAQGVWGPEGTLLSKTISVTDQWARYTFSFKALQNYMYLGFGNHNPPQEGWLYIDSIQLEKGSEASEFTTKEITAWVTSAIRGNTWQPGVNPSAALRLSGKPGTAGKVRLIETDFFETQTECGEIPFKLNDKGEETIPLPWAASLPLGVHIITMDISTESGFKGTDYGRFTVMRFLENKHLRKNLFSSALGSRYPEWERKAEFYKHVGIGSTILFDPETHGYHATLEKNGILHLSSIFDGGDGFKSLNWRQKDKNAYDLTPEKLKALEEEAYKKALAYPEVKYWKLFNEPEGSIIDNIPAMNKVVEVLLAARRGILRANPSAQVIGNDPANMYVNSGISYVNTLLQAVGDRKVFDIAAIHPYRPRPEQPDRDADTASFLKMLDRHGFKGETWFTEGIYHQNYCIPAWDLDAQRGCSSDHYRAGALSYEMGWGERMAAAYTARSWLVSLKYSDRVKLDVDWGFGANSTSDIDLTPHAMVFSANTLGNILGNATFKQDLNLGYEVRCYVFEDDQKRPVAAIWYSNIDSDYRKVNGAEVDVSALAKAYGQIQYADFMGNLHPLGSKVKIGPFPIFIIGEKESLKTFAGKLADASVIGSLGELHAYLSPKSTTEVLVNVENQRSKEFKGEFRILNGKVAVASGPLVIPPNGTWTQSYGQKLKEGTFNTTALNLEIKGGDSTAAQTFELQKNWMLWPKRKNPVSLSGKVEEWASAYQMDIQNKVEYPADAAAKTKFKDGVPWKGQQDLSAKMYAMWDETSLYLAFKVQDDVSHPNEVTRAWNGDSLQIYFDGWADASKSRTQGYGPDDQSFMIWPNPPVGTVYRDSPPERQLAFLDAGPVKNARLAVHKTADGLFYEMALPIADLIPIKLLALEKFGFAAIVNDHDNDYRKRALTLTPENTEPHRRPDLYPTVILAP